MENFLWLNFLRKYIFKIDLCINIHQVQSKVAIVYPRGTCNGNLCQVVQYYGYMDVLISGMWTSITILEVSWLVQD